MLKIYCFAQVIDIQKISRKAAMNFHLSLAALRIFYSTISCFVLQHLDLDVALYLLMSECTGSNFYLLIIS